MDTMTTTAAHIKDSSKVSGSNDFNTTTKKDNGLGGFEAISLEEYDTPDQKGSDEHGDLTETPSNRASNRKVRKDNDSSTVESLPLWDPGNCGTTSNIETDKPAKRKKQGKAEEKNGESKKFLRSQSGIKI